MSTYELNNQQGTNYRLSHGAGPGVLHDDNLARSEFQAERILADVPDLQLYDAFGYFYFTKLQRLDLSGNPRTALAQAIGESHLVIEQLAGPSAGPLAFVDKRFMIRNNVASISMPGWHKNRCRSGFASRSMPNQHPSRKYSFLLAQYSKA